MTINPSFNESSNPAAGRRVDLKERIAAVHRLPRGLMALAVGWGPHVGVLAGGPYMRIYTAIGMGSGLLRRGLRPLAICPGERDRLRGPGLKCL